MSGTDHKHFWSNLKLSDWQVFDQTKKDNDKDKYNDWDKDKYKHKDNEKDKCI